MKSRLPLALLCLAFLAADRSPGWPKVRKAYLAAHPECAACGQRDPARLAVHHVYPVHAPGGEKYELDPANLITLCDQPGGGCHLALGHLRDWRAWNPQIRADASWYRERILTRSTNPPVGTLK